MATSGYRQLEAPNPAADLGNVEKAAILMMLFGEDVAGTILQAMSPSDVATLGAAMYSLKEVSHEAVNSVLDEFFARLRDETGIGAGSGAYLRTLLNGSLGQDKAQSLLARIIPTAAERPIEILDWMDAPSIAELIYDEHPQIVALVIATLDPALAADVLRLLDEELQAEIVTRIAGLTTVQPDALEELQAVMQQKFKANTTLRASQVGGVKAAARILNHTRQAMEQRILKDIRKADKVLMQDLQDNMFVFENLIKSDDRALQTLLREVDQEQLILALKGADELVRERLLSCMSQRASANLRDEMEVMGPIRLTIVKDAQKQIINLAREMSDDGRITLAGRGGEKMV